MPAESQEEAAPEPVREISGKWVVLAVFGFAVFCTAFQWIYTWLHYAPFLPVRNALVAEFGRASAPRVEGGRPKRGPPTFRVVLQVTFDPTAETPEVRDRVAAIARRVVELARPHVTLSDYEQAEIYLVQYLPEAPPRRKEIRQPMAEWLAGHAPPADAP